MKTKVMKLISRKLLMVCSLVVGIISCQQEEIYDQSVMEMESGLYLRLATGDEGNELTRAVKEGDVISLYAFYFGTDNTSNQTDADYKYIATDTLYEHASTATSLVNPFKLKTNDASIASGAAIATGIVTDSKKGDKNRKVVFMANVQGNTTFNLTKNTTTLEDFRKMIVLTESTGVSSWGEKKGLTTNYRIPMYVCSEAVNIPVKPYDNIYYINEINNTSNSKIHYMRRMMAKFTLKNYKVQIETTEPLNYYNFVISEVAVINGNTKGLVCDIAGSYDSYTANSVNYTRVTTPSVLSAFNTSKSTSANANRLNSTTTDVPAWSASGTVITNRTNIPASTAVPAQTIILYTFETENINSSLNNIANNCYIYLKGKRRGINDAEESSEKEYMLPIYAIKADRTVNVSAPGPVLRNHHYVYNILGVDNYALFAKVAIQDWTEVPVKATPLPIN